MTLRSLEEFCCLHLVCEETGSEELSHLPKVTQLENDQVGIEPKVVLLQSPPLLPSFHPGFVHTQGDRRYAGSLASI